MDFEKGILKRKYDNLKVSVKLEGKDYCLIVLGFIYKKFIFNFLFCGINDYGLVLKNNERFKIENSLNELLRKFGKYDRNLVGDNGLFNQGFIRVGKCNEIIGRKGFYNNVVNNFVLLINVKLVNNIFEVLKRLFFYVEQNSVLLKKRFIIDYEL